MSELTLYERIKAMSLDEMASFLAEYEHIEATNYNCSRCEKEHGGECLIDEKNLDGCPWTKEETVKRWLESKTQTKKRNPRANEEIRRAIGANGLKQWQIAVAMGMEDSNFSRMLRTELSEKKKKKVLSVIEDITKGEQVNADISVPSKKEMLPKEVLPKKEVTHMVADKMTVSVEEMASMLGISRSVAYQLIKEKDFPSIRVGERRVIIPVKSLEKWLEEKEIEKI
jgi:excisionase family DNA binding protein